MIFDILNYLTFTPSGCKQERMTKLDFEAGNQLI